MVTDTAGIFSTYHHREPASPIQLKLFASQTIHNTRELYKNVNGKPCRIAESKRVIHFVWKVLIDYSHHCKKRVSTKSTVAFGGKINRIS